MRAEFKRFLRELGWREQRMRGGGYLYMSFEDRMTLINPQIWRKSSEPDSFQIDLNVALTTARFQDYCQYIFQYQEKVNHAFFRHNPPLRLYVPEISKDVAFDASARVISWVKRLDPMECLKTNLSYPNEAGPPYAVNRFIALKIFGRGAELEGVLAGVKTWDRNGFDPNITSDLVERAIALDVSAGL
jgi:hypothetical protein